MLTHQTVPTFSFALGPAADGLAGHCQPKHSILQGHVITVQGFEFGTLSRYNRQERIGLMLLVAHM